MENKVSRTSILKPRKSINVSMDNDCDPDVTTFKDAKRVSFASSNFVKPFALDTEQKTIWDNTYEEEVNHTDSIKSNENIDTSFPGILDVTSVNIGLEDIEVDSNVLLLKKKSVELFNYKTTNNLEECSKENKIPIITKNTSLRNESLMEITLLKGAVENIELYKDENETITCDGAKIENNTEDMEITCSGFSNDKKGLLQNITLQNQDLDTFSSKKYLLCESQMELTCAGINHNIFSSHNIIAQDQSLGSNTLNDTQNMELTCGFSSDKTDALQNNTIQNPNLDIFPRKKYILNDSQMEFTCTGIPNHKIHFSQNIVQNQTSRSHFSNDTQSMELTCSTFSNDKKCLLQNNTKQNQELGIFSKRKNILYDSQMEFTCSGISNHKILSSQNQNQNIENNTLNGTQTMEFTCSGSSNNKILEQKRYLETLHAQSVSEEQHVNVNNSKKMDLGPKYYLDEKNIFSVLEEEISSSEATDNMELTLISCNKQNISKSVPDQPNILKQPLSNNPQIKESIVSNECVSNEVNSIISIIDYARQRRTKSNTFTENTILTGKETIESCMSSNPVIYSDKNLDVSQSKNKVSRTFGTDPDDIHLTTSKKQKIDNEPSNTIYTEPDLSESDNTCEYKKVSSDIENKKKTCNFKMHLKSNEQPFNFEEKVISVNTEPPVKDTFSINKLDNTTLKNDNSRSKLAEKSEFYFQSDTISTKENSIKIPELPIDTPSTSFAMFVCDNLRVKETEEPIYTKSSKDVTVQFSGECKNVQTEQITKSNNDDHFSKIQTNEDYNLFDEQAPENIDYYIKENDICPKIPSGVKEINQSLSKVVKINEDCVLSESNPLQQMSIEIPNNSDSSCDSDYGNYTFRSSKLFANVLNHLDYCQTEFYTEKISEEFGIRLTETEEKIKYLLENFDLSKIEIIDLEELDKLENDCSTSRLSDGILLNSSGDNNTEDDIEGPKSLEERIRESAIRSEKYWQFVKCADNYYCFYTYYEAVPFKVRLDPDSGIVDDIETFINLDDEALPIVQYEAKYMQEKLKKSHLLHVLGSKFDILTLLDYIAMCMEEVIKFFNEFLELKEKYGKSHKFRMNADFSVTIEVLNVPYILWWIITGVMSLHNLGHINSIESCHKLSQPVDSTHIKNILDNTLGTNFLRIFFKNLNEYVQKEGNKLYAKRQEKYLTHKKK